MEIAGYEFDGPFTDPNEISGKDPGVYVVLCLVDDDPHCLLDVGTSEGAATVTALPSGNLRYYLKTHHRSDCWKEHVHGEIAYCARYIEASSARLELESELLWKFDHACGTNPWEAIEESWKRYERAEREFGPRGSYDLSSADGDRS